MQILMNVSSNLIYVAQLGSVRTREEATSVSVQKAIDEMLLVPSVKVRVIHIIYIHIMSCWVIQSDE